MPLENNNNPANQEYTRIINNCLMKVDNSSKPDYSAEIEKIKQKSNLESMSFFYNKVLENNPIKKPTVGYFCNMVPEELIMAVNANPVRLCSSDYNIQTKGEEILPSDVCPVVKSTCASLLNENIKDIDLIVAPSTCDAKTKLAEIISYTKDVYLLDIPRDVDYINNIETWVEKISSFYDFLKQKFKTKPEKRSLINACITTNKRTEIFRKIFELRGQNPGIINSFDYYLIGYCSFFTDSETFTANAMKVYNEALEKKTVTNYNTNRKKILLSGSPIIFPNFKLLEIFDELSCDVSVDTLCSTYGRLYDPVVIDEESDNEIIRALCLKYISASMCPCFFNISKLLDRIIDIYNNYKPDGVIYHNLRLCQVFEIQNVLIRNILKEKNIPLLILKTDLGKEDSGQLKTRIEAFLEMLR